MKKTPARFGLLCIFAMANITFVRADGPRIQSIEPSEGTVGQSIKLIGTNLQKTQSIDFLVGKTFRRAKFQIVSKTQLELIVPEFFRPDAKALILLHGDDRVSFTCPVTETVIRENSSAIQQNRSQSSAQVFHVVQGGVLRTTSMTTVVEKYGLVSQVQTSPLILIKAGGTIGKCDSQYPLTILYESGAQLDFDTFVQNRRWTVAGVEEIHIAEGIGPFRFRPLANDAGLARAEGPPEIQSFEPVVAVPGDTVTVKGTGFSGTTEVYVASSSIRSAGYHIVSDNLLKIELPESIPVIPSELIVNNSKGLTVTRSHAIEGIQIRTPIQTAPRHFIEVNAGTVLTAGHGNQTAREGIFLVNDGGTVASPQYTGVFLVKSGGKTVGGTRHSFHELGASIPATAKSKLVESIHVNDLPIGLRISGPVAWKP